VHTKDVSNPQQRSNPGVNVAGLDVLEGLAGDAGGEEHALLGAVLAVPFDADAVADGASAFEEPGIIVGQVGHSSDLRPLMIIGQPGKPRIL